MVSVGVSCLGLWRWKQWNVNWLGGRIFLGSEILMKSIQSMQAIAKMEKKPKIAMKLGKGEENGVDCTK